MLFIVFDIETVFLDPLGDDLFRGNGRGGRAWGSCSSRCWLFMFILAVGYVYVWKRGALEWD